MISSILVSAWFFILAQSAATSSETLQARLDDYVRPFVESGRFSGAVLVAHRESVLAARSYGMANYELAVPNTLETRFHIASISKPFTATAVLLLQERGKLHVSDPVARFVPDYPSGDKITIHHLLTHTSGIPNINDFPDYDRLSRWPHPTGELVQLFKNQPLEFSPGEKYRYSNSNYNLLAHIIEKVSGQSYGEFLNSNILKPLGLQHTGHHGDSSVIIPNEASGYSPVGVDGLEKAPSIEWSVKTGNGSLYSTVGDLMKWNRSLHEGKLLGRASRDEMFKAHVNDVMGYGWFLGRRFGRRVIRINGRSPGFTGEMQFYPDEDLSVVILSNNYSSASQQMASNIAALALGEKHEPPIFIKPIRIDAGALEVYAGTYQFGPEFFVPKGVYQVQNRGDHLFMTTQGGKFFLVPVGEKKFFERMLGVEVVFSGDSEGKIADLVWEVSGRKFKATKIAPVSH